MKFFYNPGPMFWLSRINTAIHIPIQADDTRTLCEQRRIAAMISMIVYKGQWFPKCDTQGLFMPEQCDNTGLLYTKLVHYRSQDL